MNSMMESPEQLLREWEELGHAIAAQEHAITSAQRDLAARRMRYHVIQGFVDNLTKPEPQYTPTALDRMGFEYRGVFRRHFDKVGLYLDFLQTIFSDYPDLQDRIAAAVGTRARLRCYLSRNRANLFQGKTTAWIEKHSIALNDNWWVDTNLPEERMRAILASATRVIGLERGKDVRICWKT